METTITITVGGGRVPTVQYGGVDIPLVQYTLRLDETTAAQKDDLVNRAYVFARSKVDAWAREAIEKQVAMTMSARGER